MQTCQFNFIYIYFFIYKYQYRSTAVSRSTDDNQMKDQLVAPLAIIGATKSCAMTLEED